VEQLQACGPSSGPPREFRNLLWAQGLSIELREDLLDLPQTEAEVVWTDLSDLAGEAYAREVESRFRPSGDDHSTRFRQVTDQVPQHRLCRGSGEQVSVVDEEKEPPCDAVQRERRGRFSVPLPVEGAQRKPRRSLEVRKEGRRIAVAALSSVPSRNAVATSGELREEDCLS
jgi:hypothetical protein